MGGPLLRDDRVVIVVPPGEAGTGGHAALLRSERAEFEAVLGASVEVAVAPPEPGPDAPDLALAAAERL